jgi:molecular chaperone DnaK (HSP70)
MREIVHSQRPANIIGIDLGTTEVRVARFNEQGKPEITNNAEGSDVTPAVIQIEEEGSVIIGSQAKAFLGTGAGNVFAEFKREMGTDKSWTVGSNKITPIVLSALLLKKVVTDYAEQFGQPQFVVITWPGNFGKAQREATRDAVTRAGLKAVQFIEEPTAAALYYATDTALDGKYLVYDFGGGTFDVTLIEAHGNTITVLYQDGVQQLGGKDLNDALYKIICAKFRAKTGDVFDTFDCNFDRLAIESCKQTLSTRPTVQIRLVSGKYGPIAIVVSRVEFESAIAHLIAQVEMACENVLRCGSDDPFKHVMKHEIREVFMAGEIARIPAIQASIERLFGRKPKVKIPDQAVAMGAAIYGVLKQSGGTLNCLQYQSITDVDVVFMSPDYFGLIYTNWLTGESKNITIISRGEILPVTRTFKLKSDISGYLPSINVTQSAIEETNPEFVTTIWKGELQRYSANSDINLVFDFSKNGFLSISIIDLGTGRSTKVELHLGSHER